jgi:hypothetical protein
MTDQRAFEVRLQPAFDAIADEAWVDIDAIALADRVAGSHPAFYGGLHRPAWFMPVLVGLVTLALAAGGALVAMRLFDGPHQYRGVFVSGPDMSAARDRPIVVALADGRALIAGGEAAAEVYDPDDGSSVSLVGDQATGSGSGVLLADGRVLVIDYDPVSLLTRAYLLDPEAGTSRGLGRLEERGGYNPGREPPMALLADGRVLISGGIGLEILPSALLFDPHTETFTQTGEMHVPRVFHAMVTLSNGQVLVAGGRTLTPTSVYFSSGGLLDSAELYDPATGTFSEIGTVPGVRGPAVASLLPDGRAVIVQQGDSTSPFGDVSVPEVGVALFDPATSDFEALPAGAWPGPPTVTTVADGRLLLTGVDLSSARGPQPWAALYDPITQATTALGPPRQIFPRGVLLPDKRALLVGGFTYPPVGDFGTHVPWIEIFE